MANEGNSGTIFRHNTLHANSMVPVTNLPDESPPGFRAAGRSAARKLFQGNHIAKSVVLFDSTNNWLIGVPTDQHFGQKSFALFVQDSWKLTRKITLDYGLRYDFANAIPKAVSRCARCHPSRKARPVSGSIATPGSTTANNNHTS